MGALPRGGGGKKRKGEKRGSRLNHPIIRNHHLPVHWHWKGGGKGDEKLEGGWEGRQDHFFQLRQKRPVKCVGRGTGGKASLPPYNERGGGDWRLCLVAIVRDHSYNIDLISCPVSEGGGRSGKTASGWG